MKDTIYIRDLRVETIIGIFGWEREVRQQISMDLDFEFDVSVPGKSDSIDDTLDYKKYTFRNPIIYKDQESFRLKISTIQSNSCPSFQHYVNLTVDKYPTKHSLIPANISELKSNFFEVSDIGFDGIIINETFSATECYPTPNDCEAYENQVFGQDAHNIIQGDFNGDGYEDFAVAWALFPHTIDPDQKVNAPINIYLNNGKGRFEEDLNIYSDNNQPTHPFAYRMIAEDLNDDGIDDIFAGSMGKQFRSEDYSENYINPCPHLLLLSNPEGKFADASNQIEDKKLLESKLNVLQKK